MVLILNNISIFFDMIIFEWRGFFAGVTIVVVIFSRSDTWHEVVKQFNWKYAFSFWD